MSMITVNKVLHEGSVTRVALDPNSKNFEADVKKLKRDLETKPNGMNTLVVKTETGDVLKLEADRNQSVIFNTRDQVLVNGKAAKVLFREVERPKFGEAFLGGAKMGSIPGILFGGLVGLLEAGKGFGALSTALVIFAIFAIPAGLIGSLAAAGRYWDN